MCIHYIELFDRFPKHRKIGAQCLGALLSRKEDIEAGPNVFLLGPTLFNVENQLIEWGRLRELVFLWRHGNVVPSDSVLCRIMELLGECNGKNDPKEKLSWRGNVKSLEYAMAYLVDGADKTLTEADLSFLLDPFGNEPCWYPLDLLAGKQGWSARRIIGSAEEEDRDYLREHFGSAGHNVACKRPAEESERKDSTAKRPRKTKSPKKARRSRPSESLIDLTGDARDTSPPPSPSRRSIWFATE
jgi:hypothetical protein